MLYFTSIALWLHILTPCIGLASEAYLLAPLGLVLEGENNYWKIAHFTGPSLDYQIGDILVRYGDRWLMGWDEETIQSILNSPAGVDIFLEVEKKIPAKGNILDKVDYSRLRREYHLTASRWGKGKLNLNVEYSDGRLRLGPGNIEAERQGLRLDDEIISINDRDITELSFEEIKKLMASGIGGEKCRVVIRRDISMLRKSITSQGKIFGGIGVQISYAPEGMFVRDVMDNWPAQKAGVLPEDIIIAVDGQDIVKRPFKDAVELLRGKVGTKITLTIQRTAYLPYEIIGPEYEGLGIEAHPEDGRMLITRVIQGSPAEKAGIVTGDSITSIMGQDILSNRLNKTELDRIFEPSEKETELVIQRKVRLSGDSPGLAIEREGLFYTIKSITELGSAEKAGLKEGDILIKIGDKILINIPPQVVYSLLSDRTPQGVELTIRRKINIRISNLWFL